MQEHFENAIWYQNTLALNIENAYGDRHSSLLLQLMAENFMTLTTGCHLHLSKGPNHLWKNSLDHHCRVHGPTGILLVPSFKTFFSFSTGACTIKLRS